MQDNIYDSFWVNLRLDPKVSVKPAISKLVSNDAKKDEGVRSRPFKLKRFVINQDFINVCRSYIILWSKLEGNNSRLTIPSDREL